MNRIRTLVTPFSGEFMMNNKLSNLISTILMIIFCVPPVSGQKSVVVRWIENQESDLSGYKLYYGAKSKCYDFVFDVGLTTSHKVDNLADGKKYYFALTAYDTIGNESLFSEEVSVLIKANSPASNPNSNANVSSYNFPNPFDPENEVTHIRYYLSWRELVTIKIYNAWGDVVCTLIERQSKDSGEHTEDTWDGKDMHGTIVPNGVYYCTIRSLSKNDVVTIAVLR